MERDIIDLQQLGITQSVIDNFREAISAAASLPNDEYLTGLMMIAHENRDRKAGEVRQMLAGIAARVGAVFGRQSAAYKALGAETLSHRNPLEIRRICEQSIEFCTPLPEALVAEGLTDAVLTALAAQQAALESLVAEARLAKSGRILSSEAKTEAYNSLCDRLVKYSMYGKLVLGKRNAAKYQAYLIYDSSVAKTPPEAIAGLGFDEETEMVFWQDAASKSSCEAEIDKGSTITNVLIGKDSTEFALARGATAKRIRIRRRNAAGVGAWSAWLVIPAAGHKGTPSSPPPHQERMMKNTSQT